MKVGFCLDIDGKDANSGKHKFFIRLAREFRKKGIEVTNKKPDIYIYLVGGEKKLRGAINILRLDGLILNSKWEHKKINNKLKKSIKCSDGLIYQGKFCKDAYEQFLGIRDKSNAVISNGADPNEFLNRNPQKYFLANCKWRPHKRLKIIVKSFIKASNKSFDYDLIVTGEVDKKIKHNRVHYLGWQKYKKLRVLLSEAVASFHLSWLDWCPNSMVEAIVARCPVIYTMSGGHHELGEGNGIAINDQQWDFKICDLYNPPLLNKREIINAMKELSNNKFVINDDKLYIDKIADKYIDYFKSLLEAK